MSFMTRRQCISSVWTSCSRAIASHSDKTLTGTGSRALLSRVSRQKLPQLLPQRSNGSSSQLRGRRTFTTATEALPQRGLGRDGVYDCCVLGCGPAGFAATVRAWDYGRSVCVIEKAQLGGASIHDGALSSKMMWEMAHESRLIKARVPSFTDNYSSMVDEIGMAQSTKTSQMLHQLQTLDGIHLKHGTAKFLSPNEVLLEKTNGETEVIRARNFVIATGSYPRRHREFDCDGDKILNSDDIMKLKDFPKDLLIVGAGVIGCEFATIFSNFGTTKIHLLNERRPRLLPFEDSDLSLLIENNIESANAKVYNDVELLDLDQNGPGGKVRATVKYCTQDRPFTLDVEKVLFAIGRVPAVDNIDVERAGLQLCNRGGIWVNDEHGQSMDQSHIYVAGDASADVGLVNVAEMEGRHAVEHMYRESSGGGRGKMSKMHYENLSSIMFLEPEVACIGLNETEAARRGVKYISGTYGYDLVNRAMITSGKRRKMGYVKLVVSEDDEMNLLGIRAVGPEASAVIECASLILHEQRPLSDLQKFLRPHPSISEAVQECVRVILGTSLYKPSAFPNSIRLSCSEDGLKLLDDRHVAELGISRATVPTYLDLH